MRAAPVMIWRKNNVIQEISASEVLHLVDDLDEMIGVVFDQKG